MIAKFDIMNAMKHVKLFFEMTALALCFASSSCSQTTKPQTSSSIVFEASTPCKVDVKTMLEISADDKCDFIRWKLALQQDEKTLTPSGYILSYTYGLGKQGTRGFTEGAKTTTLEGRVTINKGIAGNPNATVYKLTADNSTVTLLFLKAGENLLHLLGRDKRLMIGSAAWSYTLSRTHPVPSSSSHISKQVIPVQRMTTDSPVVGVFEGRTPCNDELRKLNGISAGNCQIIKCQLILYKDTNTHQPSGFLLHTIYVGAGDTKYSNTGEWTMTQGTKNDPAAVVYHLNFDKPAFSISLLRADDNILFFLDKDENYLVGNVYTSYTLNRAKK
jgi:hypothetical protein